MKLGFYPKLALDGIRKNKRLYYPYILTCVGMVMMFYIIHYLAAMPVLSSMAGGRSTAQMLGFGTWIVALFALIFLFYTNSFLMRRRKKEFGLYNMLGMGKGNLSRMLLWETVIAFGISMAMGLLAGIGLSKLAELCLTRILGGEVTYDFSVNGEALADTFVIFAPIFCLIFLKNLGQIWRLSAVSLLRSESVGEKPPRANYLLGIGGIALLAWAYYTAVTIQSPLMALNWFFVAVGMVVVATYLLFISGSVMLCRLLQKNKGYYYRKNHFVSVSSMAYRMKRNGAGLASICILSTMVLVMMHGSASLFFGAEDSLRTRYPRDIYIKGYSTEGDKQQPYSEEAVNRFLKEVRTVVDGFGTVPREEQWYLKTSVTGMLQGGKLVLDPEKVENLSLSVGENVCNLVFVPLADYNRCMGANETLEEDQVLLHCFRRTYDDSFIALETGTVWRVKKQVEKVMLSGDAAMDVLPSVFVIVPNLEKTVSVLNRELRAFESYTQCYPVLSYSFDTELPAKEEIALYEALCLRLNGKETIGAEGEFNIGFCECREAQREEFYGSYAGVFFLGIILSIVFMLATVLIICYKQISEGYEDQARFDIMQKVGMTREDIQKSVNSQMLTVFFLPLATAGLHTAFAFPMVQKLLALFNLRNTALMLLTFAATVLVFGLFYAVVYKVTANAYFAIVSGAKNE